MKYDTNPYTNSIYILPAIDVSQDVNYLKRLFVVLNLEKSPKLYYQNKEIINIQTKRLRYSYDWYGDCVEINDPIENKTLFFGFINNFLIGFGDLSFEINNRNIKKLDIQLNTILKKNESEFSAFGMLLPYKNYQPKFDYMKYFEGIESEQNPNWNKIKTTFTPSFEWKKNAPKIEINKFKDLWDDSWVDYRLNTFYPEGPFNYRWISPCRYSKNQYDKLAMWDTLHIIEDLKWYDIESAINMMEMHFGMFRPTDGMVAQDRSCGDDFDGGIYVNRVNGNNYKISQPPIWSYTLMELSKMLGDYSICNNYFDLMVKNVEWWEKNRYFPEYNLFGYNTKPSNMANELGLDNSPRFYYRYDGNKWKKALKKSNRKILPVDLNSQMADYYQNLGVFAMIKEDERMGEYFQKAEDIIDSMNEYLWDDDEKFFFDYDIDVKMKQPLYSASSLFALFGGAVLKGYLRDFVSHLTDPNKFWTDLPVPTVSLNSKFYEEDMWRGPTWISQNYWIIVGLKRYNLGDIAADLSRKCLEFLENSYFNYSKIFEFYNPVDISQKSLKRKGKKRGPFPYYIGHFPIHAIFYYGLMGGEILDDNVSFIPKIKNIHKNYEFEIFYNNKKRIIKIDKTGPKLIEITR